MRACTKTRHKLKEKLKKRIKLSYRGLEERIIRKVFRGKVYYLLIKVVYLVLL